MKYARSSKLTTVLAATLGAFAVVVAAGLAGSGDHRAADAQAGPQLPYKARLPQLARDGLSPVGQNAFTTSAAVTRTGGVVRIAAAVQAAQNDLVVVDIEIYGPLGDRVDQQYFNGAALNAQQSRTFNVSWTPPAGARPGEYTVKLGIFATGPEWETLFHWNNKAATFSLP